MRTSASIFMVVGVALATIVFFAFAVQRASQADAVEQVGALPQSTVAVGSTDEQVLRGRYLVRIGSCNDCHTPWVFDEELGVAKPDMSRMLSGHPDGGPEPTGTLGAYDMGLIGPTFTSFALPFGVLYSANLTPDVDTGIGSWTEQMFVDIFRKGRHLGGDGRGVLPPMPWFWIRNMTDDDLKAVYAYLNSIPAIRNPVPAHKVSDEVVWQLRDGLDRMAAELPQEEWAARSGAQVAAAGMH
ncbi:MAG: diheme cytochrome c-553 [Thermoanaerobaculia bacterium]|nr:diheme cytochrome c-553 [Thermoanaerobaculia bacterium]